MHSQCEWENESELVTMYLLEHLQCEGPVFGQPLTLLRGLQAELVGLVLQGRHLLLKKTTQKGVDRQCKL